MNDFTQQVQQEKQGFSAAPLGDVDILRVTSGKGYIIQKAAYLASEKDVSLDVEWQGFTKGLFGQGLFMIKVAGEGLLFINTFEQLTSMLAAGERLIVDNFHLVAFSDSCQHGNKIWRLERDIAQAVNFLSPILQVQERYISRQRIFARWLTGSGL